MHLPKVKAVAIPMIIALVLLAISGCRQESTAPAVPTDVQFMDIPDDNGTNVVLSWTHYKASLARQYNIYYSTDKDSIEDEELMKKLTPIERSVQASVTSIGDSITENVCDLDYYLILKDTDTETPQIDIVKATDANQDSLKKFGEKIILVEGGLFPVSESTIPIVNAQGNFYRIKDPGDIGLSIKTTVENSNIVTDSTGFALEESDESVIFDIELSKKELAFREAGDRIVEYDPSMSDYFIKYGEEIVGVVTEKNRYTLSTTRLQSVIRGTIESGVEYHYRVVADNTQGNTTPTDVMSFTPQNEPPMPPANTSARFDSSKGEILFSWVGFNPGLGAFIDVREYRIRRYEAGDTLCESGEIIAGYGSEHSESMVKGIFGIDDMFYIESSDNSDQRSVSEPFGVALDVFSPPEIVEELGVVDVDNDDGSGLSVIWGNPEIALDIGVKDPSPKFVDKKLPDGYYLIETEEGKRIQHFEPGDSTIPIDANRITDVKQSVISDVFDVTVSYRIFKNDKQDVFYAKIKLDDGKFENDFQSIGFFEFECISAGEHTFEAVLLNKAAKELENPEAWTTKTVDIHKHEVIRDERSSEIVEVWRTNPEIEKNGEVLLAGVPGFDPKNKNTFEKVGMASVTARQLRDSFADSLRDKGEYYYFVREKGDDGSFVDSDIFGPNTPKSQFFHKEKAMVLALVILFVVFVNVFLTLARKGRTFYLRPIAGISHLDEALGRATEMGRPILYILGLTGIGDIATLAGLTILGRVAKKAAEFQTRIIVPCVNPIVMIVAQETVKTACMDAGRPDLYNEDDVFYAAGSQFSYAAAVAGLMVRYKTAANFYMGMFFAESLILTETGSMTGSIQIAGTDAVTQIPFFITTCDYTLIGEELYAASAYLSHDPLQVGTLKAQDMLKAIYMVVIVLGTVAMTSGFMWFVNLFKIRLEQ